MVDQVFCLVLFMKLAKLVWIYSVMPLAVLYCADVKQSERNGNFECLSFLLPCQKVLVDSAPLQKMQRHKLK